MTIQEMITQAWELRTARLAEQKHLDEMELEEKSLMAQIKEDMLACGSDYTESRGIKVTVFETVEPEVVDWQAYQDHIRATGELDLLQKRPMVSAIKARWEAGDDVPGIQRLHGYKATLGVAK